MVPPLFPRADERTAVRLRGPDRRSHSAGKRAGRKCGNEPSSHRNSRAGFAGEPGAAGSSGSTARAVPVEARAPPRYPARPVPRSSRRSRPATSPPALRPGFPGGFPRGGGRWG
ncbi:hypothetical protein E4P82_18035 [Candidatus Competibacter phosphatis]|uniref:Uncharacterized protein n=1 Tax=Candidatus Competibacter phosphatis TaxID=221280 RepID=A0ABX1TNF2_9GAMM|nr:hypothetical protein [Candidatus Competibacter phosphatis]